MTIVITGANGFIGKNLVADLQAKGYNQIVQITRETTEEQLKNALQQATFVFHLAGINRPLNEDEFMEGNHDFTRKIVGILRQYNSTCPILVTSSTQAELDNAYGASKRAGEEVIHDYAAKTGANTYIYRLPNVFGKWCKPNYNSVIATFCYNISRGLDITVNDSSVSMNLVYIDDVIEEFVNVLNGKVNRVDAFCEIPAVHTKQLGDIVELLHSFKRSREERAIPTMTDLLKC